MPAGTSQGATTIEPEQQESCTPLRPSYNADLRDEALAQAGTPVEYFQMPISLLSLPSTLPGGAVCKFGAPTLGHV